MTINWDAVGAAGEIIGALAVLVTLVYLARQMRQNNLLMKEQADYNLLQNQISLTDALAREPELLACMYQLPEGEGEQLSAVRRSMYLTGLLYRWQWEFQRVEEGVMRFEDLQLTGMRLVWHDLNMAASWEELKTGLRPHFVEQIEKHVMDQQAGAKS
jgi:hypothetical protein